MKEMDMADEQLLAQRPREKADLSDYLREPFQRLRSEVDRFLDDFPPRFPAPALSIRQLASMPMPALEMTEMEKEYHLCVEVPGVPAKDVDISVEGDLLVLKGEKKEAHEEKERNYCVSERSYGAFERRVTLPPDAMADDISASSENGVLTIVIPRAEQQEIKRRKIEVRG
jgi:HSP20 family protein